MKSQSELDYLEFPIQAKKKKRSYFQLEFEHEFDLNNLINLSYYITNLSRFTLPEDERNLDNLYKLFDRICAKNSINSSELELKSSNSLQEYGQDLNNKIGEFKANSVEFKRPDEYMGIGAELVPIGEERGILIFRVEKVNKGTPAEVGGVETGDLIRVRIEVDPEADIDEKIKKALMKIRNNGISLDNNDILITSEFGRLKNLQVNTAILKQNQETQDYEPYNFIDKEREVEVRNRAISISLREESDSDREDYKWDSVVEDITLQQLPKTTVIEPKTLKVQKDKGFQRSWPA